MKNYRFIILAVSIIVLSGCLSTQDVIPMSKDTYMIRVEDHAGIFAFNRGKMKGEALKKADSFAKGKGQVAIPLSMKEHPVGILGDWPAVEYQFRLVSEDSPLAAGGYLEQRADFVIESNENIQITDDNTKSDTYESLLKLDKLRKQGVITDEEFEVEKKKLLNH
jgi:hypothetical protein